MCGVALSSYRRRYGPWRTSSWARSRGKPRSPRRRSRWEHSRPGGDGHESIAAAVIAALQSYVVLPVPVLRYWLLSGAGRDHVVLACVRGGHTGMCTTCNGAGGGCALGEGGAFRHASGKRHVQAAPSGSGGGGDERQCGPCACGAPFGACAGCTTTRTAGWSPWPGSQAGSQGAVLCMQSDAMRKASCMNLLLHKTSYCWYPLGWQAGAARCWKVLLLLLLCVVVALPECLAVSSVAAVAAGRRTGGQNSSRARPQQGAPGAVTLSRVTRRVAAGPFARTKGCGGALLGTWKHNGALIGGGLIAAGGWVGRPAQVDVSCQPSKQRSNQQKASISVSVSASPVPEMHARSSSSSSGRWAGRQRGEGQAGTGGTQRAAACPRPDPPPPATSALTRSQQQQQ